MPSTLSEYADAVYVAKGIGIILVVIGHYQPDWVPNYWQWLHDFIYTFHMPLFMFLSGFLFAAGKPVTSLSQYHNLIRSKAKRLLIPFLSLAIIIFFLKYLGGLFFHLIYPLSFSSVVNIFLNPIESFAPILWFLYVLFVIFALFGIFYLFIHNEFYILIVFGLMFFLPWLDIFMLGTMLFYLPIFTLGFICLKHNTLKRANLSLGLIFLVSFGLLLVFRENFLHNDLILRIYRLLLGIMGSAACFFIAMQVSNKDNKFFRVLKYFGIYSMGIYILHAPIMSSARIFLLQVIKISDYWFLPVAFISINIGILLPIILEKYVLRRSALAAGYILGIRVPA